MIRVLIADDEPLIRAGIVAVLESDPGISVVAQVEDGRAAVERASRPDVDVVLVDIRMPVLDGLGVVEELHRRRPELPVVVLTSFGAEPNVLRAVEHRAAGFLLKNCTPAELIGAVSAAHAGEAYLSPAAARIVLGLVAPDDIGRRQDAIRRLAALTGREREVAGLVAEGLSNAEIARRSRTSETTVKTYVSRVLTKLGCENRVQVALLVRDAG
ncbi:response regulator transcription factor [Cryptosporangium aurantiacum]|uniref:Two component transcriptional regulator, LuxR family n=1 Tax=Cryptosporangium aurantiacum TaxID=134849 RepID=A0A1M7QVV6_9ACTN|nr:response regulator transcription factor [Cryptosporangium aurantiacum]SHN36120.1 two component transcriptional regulator, LuxR family [Cryptosporangium aurantiacum]